jgi:cytochrome b561
MSPFEIILAKTTHFLLYAIMLIQPLTGITMSQLSGHTVSLFGWVSLPTLFSKNKYFGDIFYQAHVWGSYLIIGLVSLHVLAALYHHIIKKDMVLRRMMPFG